MKKVKTVKGKIATGVIAASLVGTFTFAFASTNAGTQFTAWGQSQIDAAKSAIEDSIDGSRASALSKVDLEAKADRDAAKVNVDQAGAEEKTDTKSKIEGKLAEHVTSLQAALATFMSSIGGDFDTLVTTENGETTSKLNTLNASLSTDITNVLTAAKESNVNNVTEQSLLVKGQATSDLIKEINRVKSALQAQIDSEKLTAQGEVDAHLLSEVNRINGLLDTLISGLENSAKEAIAAAGLAVENSADANFDRVISRLGVETPLKVDPQDIQVIETSKKDGILKFKVVNSNEFDVVFRYQYRVFGGEGGVSETPYAESAAQPGEIAMEFDTWKFFGRDVPGTLFIQYMDENGDFKYLAEIANH
jgi:hypothetical protein